MNKIHLIRHCKVEDHEYPDQQKPSNVQCPMSNDQWPMTNDQWPMTNDLILNSWTFYSPQNPLSWSLTLKQIHLVSTTKLESWLFLLAMSKDQVCISKKKQQQWNDVFFLLRGNYFILISETLPTLLKMSTFYV